MSSLPRNAQARADPASDLEARRAETRHMLEKYPEKIPIICEKAPRCDLPSMGKKKFLVPGTMLCGEFKYIVHKHINQTGGRGVASDQTIYLFIGNNSPRTSSAMADIYGMYKSNDGFLYITYTAENTLGQ